MAARQAGSTDAIQIQETNNNYYGLKHAVGQYGLIAIQIQETNNNYYGLKHAVGQYGHTIVRTTFYKMRGWNPVTQQFEHWEAINPNAGPNSGNNLTNITIAHVINGKFPPIA